MRKILIHLIISVMIITSFVLIEFKAPKKFKQGIEFLRDSNKLAIYSSEDVALPYYIGFDRDESFIQTTVENSTVSQDSINYIAEYSFKGTMLSPNSIASSNHSLAPSNYSLVSFRHSLAKGNPLNEQTKKYDLRVTNRFFNNSDALVFLRFATEDNDLPPIEAYLEIPIPKISTVVVRSLIYEASSKPTEISATNAKMLKYEIEPSGEVKFSILPATLNYIELKRGCDTIASILMGPLSIFEDKEIHLRELEAQKFQPVMSIENGKIIQINFSFNLSPSQYEENWFFLSRGKLLNYDDQITLENMLSADLCMRKKLSVDGIYHIASSLYYVGASDISYDYYYNYAMWEGRRFMDLYLNMSPQRFFYDIALNSIYTTQKAVNTYGVWVSDVRSKYLWDTYGIGEGYIDTRYCTDAGFFLLKANEEFQILDAIKAGEKFGNYLIGKYRDGEVIITKNGGILFYDYYSKDKKIKTHASLNHILSEMNYFYELYLATNNEDYLNTADLIKKALDDTRDNWIRRDGSYRFRDDLWYGVYENNDGSLTFKDLDYTKTLTYEDLKRASGNILKVYGRQDETINILIESKKKFLIREGFKLED